MADVDLTDSYADAYIRSMRCIRAMGMQPAYHRAPINGDEADRMRRVNALISRSYHGYRPSAEEGEDSAGPRACERCGRPFADPADARLVRAIYRPSGRVDVYRCRGGCPAASAEEAAS
jgi:hypothetical protein